jgi:ABC-type nitrate/sulfonate/bicarbonate transport system substrate-binding protein
MKTTSRKLLLALALAAAAVAAVGAVRMGWDGKPQARLTEIAVQLPWFHSGAFAGYYAADQGGAYADEGLKVKFLEGAGAIDPLLSVLDGRARFGIASANHLLQARSEGKPVRAIAVMHQLNPIVFTTLEGSGITHPKQFAGKTIRASATNLPIVRALAQKFGIAPGQYTVSQLRDTDQAFAKFYAGEIDVMTGFQFSTPYKMEKDGKKGRFMSPDNYGVHFYRDCIFTTEAVIAEHPELVADFLRATLKEGWADVVRNPQKASALVVNYAPGADTEYAAKFLTALLPMINTGEHPIGWMKPEVWAAMAKALGSYGVLAAPLDPAQAYTMRFLREVYGSAP